MSLKDLFQVKKVLPPVSNEQIAEEVESVELIDSYSKDKERIEFAVDYSAPSNFAVFGSAEKYYNDSIERIYSQYPYDGSKKEKLDWYNSSSLLDIWFYENAYPKTTGYAIFSPSGWSSRIGSQVSGYGEPTAKEYIVIKGGPNTNSGATLKSKFLDSSNQDPKSNVYDVSNNRNNNLQYNLNNGLTLEFWFNKTSFVTSSTEKEVIFDLWNGELSSSSGYGRLTLEISGTTGSPFYLTAQSGTAGFFRQNVGSTPTTSSIVSGWNHYAVSLVNSSSAVQAKFYINGNLDSTQNLGSSINDINGSLIANIGALRTAPSGTSGVSLGWGKLSGSIDDFRFWKTQRNSREIGRNWWGSVGGGTNTDDSNTDLGFYYKFNEGITTTSSIDSIVLDYSGRVSNGTWVGYSADSRNTGSALTNEEQDPIIYSTHPEVVTVSEEYQVIGQDYDRTNPNAMYYSFPDWIVEEDVNSELLNLTQIASSYLDTLYLQIKYFTSIKDRYNNIQIDEKPFPFSKTLLESTGLVAPSLFVDAKIFEEVLSQDNERKFEDKLDEIKNVIYQNIYSNLTDILKSKGTEKAFRNMLHCFGVDESLVNINIYSNNNFLKVKDNLLDTTLAKKVVNFNDPDRFNSSIYQYKISSNPTSYSYITSSTSLQYLPFTAEVEVVFPKKLVSSQPNYFNTLFVETSIFGAHTPVLDPNDLTWDSNDKFNFQVYAIRNAIESSDVKFALSSSNSSIPLLTSSLYTDVYNNEKWNFAVRFYPNKLINLSNVSGTTDTTYTIEFYGINSDGGVVKNEFLLTSSLSNADGTNIAKQSRRFYLGAEHTNFTSSVIRQTDLKLSSLRYWSTYLSNEEIKNHSFNPNNYGVESTYENAYFNKINNLNIPKIDTLMIDWSFATVTGSDSGVLVGSNDGKFTFNNYLSGNLNYSKYNSNFNNLKKYEYTGRGDFLPQNNTDFINTQYNYSSKLTDFENLNASNLINVLGSEDQNIFTKQTRPINYYYSFEKSMYRTISEEMLNMFSTILDFNNLVGDPVNKYRKDYKSLGKLRQLFFERVKNEPDLDKYLDFYKWIDSAVGKLLFQLAPASADTSEGLLNVIESHTLERNKHQFKFPTMEFKVPVLEAGAQSINRHFYNWRIGYHPLSNDESDNTLYWNERAERDVTPISSSNSDVNASRKQLLNVSLQALNRSFTTPYRLKLDESKAVQGGVNFSNNKNLEFATVALTPHGPMDTDSVINVPANYLFAGIPSTSSLLQDCNDVLDPIKKVKYYFTTVHGRDYLSSSLGYGEILSSKIALPANFISGTVTSGYQSQVASEFMNGVIITNIHNDTYGSRNEVPVQGPFTNQWVGGRQSRHVALNQGTDTYTTRPEAWKILLGTGSFSGPYQAAIGFVGADYPYPEGNPDSPSYPVRAHKRATYLREETAKRPVNIKNIRSSTGSIDLGNYEKNYQVVHTVGATTNNRELLDAENPTINTELAGIIRTNVTNGKVDFTLPTRQKSETVIRNKFSAPGDYRTNSRGYLNRYAEELSPYNVNGFRNRQVIGDGRRNGESLNNDKTQYPEIIVGATGDFNTLQAKSSLFGGYQTGSATVPSIHKVNKNPLTTVDYSGDTSTQITKDNDNGFFTHQIPQNDAGYAWIRASVPTSSLAYYGYLDNQISNGSYITVPSGSTSVIKTLDSISASEFGSYLSSSDVVRDYIPTFPFIGDTTQNVRILGEDKLVSGSSGFIPTDFVGLNIHLLNYPTYTTLDFLTNIDLLNETNNAGERFEPFTNLYYGYESIFGGLLNFGNDTLYFNNQYVYSENDWREALINSGYFRVINNFYGAFNSLILNRNGPYGYTTFKQVRNSYHPVVRKQNQDNYITLYKNNNFIIEKEPVVYYNKPNRVRFKDVVNNKELRFLHTLNNLKQSFENINLFNNITIEENKTFYDLMLKLLLNNSQYKLLSYELNTSIFPVKNLQSTNIINTYFDDYYETAGYWRDLRKDRDNWNMDNWYLNSELSSSDSDIGLLQTVGNVVHGGNLNNISKYVLYSYKQMLSSKHSYMSINNTNRTLSLPSLNIDNGLLGGTEPWIVGQQANKNPYYNSYKDWLEQINKSKYKNYSILPQYIISSDSIISNVLNNKLNDDLTNELKLATAYQTETTNQVQTYSDTNFVKDVEIINNDLIDTSNKIKLSLNCDSIIKFNPTPDGELYPQNRSYLIANQFRTSTDQYYTRWRNSKGITSNTNGFRRNITTPLVSPGVLYNTIKSGIAVDYPVMTGSLQITQSQFDASSQIDYQINNNSFDKRIPFEALLKPEVYLNIDLIYSDSHPSSSANVTSSWTGQYESDLYKLNINNFLAESINFFLADNRLTTLYSKPENEFSIVEPGKCYRALVKIYKSSNGVDVTDYLYYNTSSYTSYRKPQYPRTNTVETINMYSRPSGFGPACAGGVSGSSIYTNNIIDSTNGYYAPYTPPYYDGEGWALLTFTPTGSTPYKPTLQEIFNNLQIKYLRYEVVESELGTGGPQGKGNLNANAMQVSASLNLLNLVNLNQIAQNITDATTTSDVSKAWAIQTKFETPILHFDTEYAVGYATGSTQVPYGTAGMWHQYGSIPTETQGIYLQITDVPEDFSRYGKEYDYRTAADTSTRDPSLTGSLADIVGFSKSPSKLGKIASSREIKEAVVAIPYIEENNSKRYIKLNDNAVRYLRKQYFGLSQDIEQVETDIALSVSDTIKKQFTTMKDYVFPPNFDFINNLNIDPIAMYIFEFKYTLSQQDLADIWQGVLPDIGYKFEEQTSVITHELNENELIDKSNLNEKLKFFVFKVKQKAKNNYFERLVSSIQEKDSKKLNTLQKVNRTDGIDFSQIDQDLTYSYNWPYDFFSLIELAKIDAKVEYINEEENTIKDLSSKSLKALTNNSKKVEVDIAEAQANVRNNVKPLERATTLQQAAKIKQQLSNVATTQKQTLNKATTKKVGKVENVEGAVSTTLQTNTIQNNLNSTIQQNGIVAEQAEVLATEAASTIRTTTSLTTASRTTESTTTQAQQVSSNRDNTDAVGSRSSASTTTNVSTSSRVNPQTITTATTTNNSSVTKTTTRKIRR